MDVPSLPAHPARGSVDGEDVSAVKSPADTHGYASMSLGFETCHSRSHSVPGAVQLLLSAGNLPPWEKAFLRRWEVGTGLRASLQLCFQVGIKGWAASSPFCRVWGQVCTQS